MSDKLRRREKRRKRIRSRVMGTPERPRLSVRRSLRHIQAQIIDDINGETLISASTHEPELRRELDTGGNREAASRVGRLIAERAREKEIEQVVFDRGGDKFHGRIKALAEAAREGGLEF